MLIFCIYDLNKTIDLGCADRVKHVIRTGSAAPIKQAPRRLPQSQMEEAERQI